MIKTKFMSALFIAITLAFVTYATIVVIRDYNYQTGIFNNDGYAIFSNNHNKNKAEVLTFESGTKYNFKKFNNKVSFNSSNGNVRVDDSTVIHYQDNSLLVLKDTVGINLSTVDSNIIFYYNIFKNTEIKYQDGKCVINLVDGNTVSFDQLLLRITDTKFLLVGNNIRVVLSNDEIASFDNYVYFEYTDGSVIKIYNNDRYYQTISDNSSISVSDIVINLKEETISKKDKKYISLSNLVIDRNGNIDVIAEELKKGDKLGVSKSSVDPNQLSSGDEVPSSVDGTNSNEQLVDEDKILSEPIYRVTKLAITALKIDATIEIEDKDSLLSSPTDISIVENKTAKTVYELTIDEGELYGNISYPNLKPDTEYTLYAKASYTLDDVTYDKTFISKIFRTEALGVSFDKAYVTNNSISVLIEKEDYSKVTSVVLGIYDQDGGEVDYRPVELSNLNNIEVTFNNLDNNATYMVKMYDILSSGVVIDDGYSIKKTFKTLKKAPSVGKLEYTVNKKDSSFELNAFDVEDKDHGIVGYRYEIFDARGDITDAVPVTSISNDKLDSVSIKVDDNKIHRGISYTYRLIVEFYDNEKSIEYSYDLGETMQLDGVEFPTVRWEETNVTWEQINGSIIIDDPSGTIMSDKYRVVYKNSLGTYSTMSLTSETSTSSIPIAINYLRANETYTFDVYATINLQDGNPTVNETYIGSVKVQTKKPNSLRANYQNNLNYTSPFSIDFNLSDTDKDASLEASTLSTLNFTLYQGSTTEGMVEIYRKTTDINSLEYQSSLKNQFYDDIAVINANFFNSNNESFKQKTYTLVVDDAYDYTGFNKIPIENNVFTFETNAFIPELPNVNDPQITNYAIINKYAKDFGLTVNPNLDPNTIVGYSLNAIFDNSNKRGKYIVYHVWRYNHVTGKYEKLSNLDKKVNFNSDGTQPNAIFEIGNGTSNGIVDSDMLRRGNTYYFTFEAYIDLNNDGEAETVYPNSIDSSVKLASAVLNPKKQSSDVLVYPSSSNNDTFTWKYIVSDIDNSLSSDKLYGFMNSNTDPTSSINIVKGSTNYQLAQFTGLIKNSTFTMKKKERLSKNIEDSYQTITSQYFYGYRSTLNLNYSVSAEVNKFVITIDDYLNRQADIDAITKLDIKISPVNNSDLERLGTKIISDVMINDGCITIDYEDISEYMKVDIAIDLVAYFDSNAIGFDLSSTYKVIQKGSYSDSYNYYTLKNDKINHVASIYGAMVKTTFDDRNNTLTLTDLKNSNYIMQVGIDETGVVYENNNIILKEIRSEQLASNDKVVRFDFIIPSISLMNSSNKVNIVPLLTGASINAKLINNNPGIIKDDYIYIELFEVDKNGLNATYVDTIKKKTNDFNSQIELSNLKLHTNYYLKFYANIYNASSNSYQKYYLYDVQQKIVGCSYNFHTLSNVGIENVTGNLISNSYADKRLVINYNVDNTIGYDFIKYTLYKLTDDGYQQLDVDIPDSKVFMNLMKVEISAPPSEATNISYGDEYMIHMDIYANYVIDGVDTVTLIESDDASFKLNNYEEPFIGISSSKTDDAIIFRVSVIDSSNLIVGGTYDAILEDSKGNIITIFSNQKISEFNKKFTFDKDSYNLVDGEQYTFKVKINVDYDNTGSNYHNTVSSRTITCGYSLYLGTITLSQNDEGNINMIFANSYQLNTIDKISYTITNDTENIVYNATKSFDIHYDKDNDVYYYTIDLEDSNFNPNLLYLVTINFYSENRLIESVELGYGGRS